MRRLGWLILPILLLGGCSWGQKLQDTPAYKEFCSWSPVAIAAIGGAVIESSNDPNKQEATRAMSQALVFLKLAAAQCPPVTP